MLRPVSKVTFVLRAAARLLLLPVVPALLAALPGAARAQIITESTPPTTPPNGTASTPHPKPRHRRPKPKAPPLPPASGFAAPKLQWRTLLRASSATPSVSADGIFVASGTLLLQLDIGGRTLASPEIGPSSAPPITDDNRLYVGTNRGVFYAIDRHSGRQMWKAVGAGDAILTAATLGEGRVYFESNDNYVYALAAMTGGPIWKFLRPDGSLGYSSPVFSGGALYVCGDSAVYRLDPATGKQVWHTPVGGKSLSTPFVDDQRLYVGADGPGLTALALSDGHQIWSFAGKSGKEWFGPPLAAEGIVYASANDRDIDAFDAATGKLKWSLRLLAGSLTQPALDPKTHVLYVASTTYADTPTLTAIDARTGLKLWDDKLGSINGSPVVSGDNLFVASSTGFLYCFSLAGK